MAQSAAGAQRADKFYLLTSADQMTATFNPIGTNLAKLRVAQEAHLGRTRPKKKAPL